jgi:hypothetical protein
MMVALSCNIGVSLSQIGHAVKADLCSQVFSCTLAAW